MGKRYLVQQQCAARRFSHTSRSVIGAIFECVHVHKSCADKTASVHKTVGIGK